MALFSFPRFLLVNHQPLFHKQQQRYDYCYSSFTPGGGVRSASFPVKVGLSFRSSMGVRSGAAEKSSKGAAIIWFKHDLRVDDHPGLVAAAAAAASEQQHSTLVPLYVFDRRILSRFSDEMLELLLFALEDLRKSLKDQGSNLMIRFGNAENVIEELVKEVKATSIYAEEEVEYELHRMLDAVKETLTFATGSSDEVCPRMAVWSSPFYGMKNLEDLPEYYDNFKKLKLPVVSPVLPVNIPGPEMDLTWGDLPNLDDLKKFVVDDVGSPKNKWTSTIAKNEKDLAVTLSKLRGVKRASLQRNDHNIGSSNITGRKRPLRSAFVSRQKNSVGGGTSNVLNALAAYLRYLEGTARDEWQEVHEKLREAESREGASFGALFGSALLLGIISRRRVYYEAIKYEKERNGGFLSPFGYSAITVAAAVNSICSMEWYWILALRSQITKEGIYSVRIWRWNGYLVHYTVSGHKGPAVLLVHGFGAFLEHYRDNISNIADAGNRVWAITLLGFGKSEKPNIVYTEVTWAELVRDFIIQVVGEPVHLVGNSIGGYFVAIVAGLWPALAKSLVLINGAGNVIPEYSAVHLSEDRQTSGAAWFGARLLLLYLRFNIRNIVKSSYPSKMDRADDWLINEMLRASHDPGVLVVMECIFSFDLSIPLNYLLEEFGKKVLVIQGMKDPLSDSGARLAVLREHCKGVVTRELNAGHCPHDELPAAVNSVLLEWVVTVEREGTSVGLVR
ncbi:hypothetical protein ACH5RR_017012 [Cinchona calisaya]|uniref:Photolyase/cryptochrome alpha/beta domain-containing protein n=1 Tax=Cinchona calisaya TaxID=153742 RepID=A0ABD3A379_9GENT